MMKRLEYSTVVRALQRHGWVEAGYKRFLMNLEGTCQRAAIRLDNGEFVVYDAGLKEARNVKLVSDWPWPTTLAGLRKTLDQINEIYGKYCGTFQV